MEHRNLEIEWLPIDTLSHFAHNSKIHTGAQIEHIANSIKRFGFNDPLAIAGEDNTILEGNGRIEAAKSLGMQTLPCVRLDHLSAEEQRVYVIAHNALCLETGFDEPMLLQELQALQNSFDLTSLGIDEERYLSRLDALEKKELAPYQQVHYLISLDINAHDKVVDLIHQLQETEGVEVDSTLN